MIVYTQTWKSVQSPKQHTKRMGRTAFRKSVQSVQNKVDATFRSAIADASKLRFRLAKMCKTTCGRKCQSHVTNQLIWRISHTKHHVSILGEKRNLHESIPCRHKSLVLDIGFWWQSCIGGILGRTWNLQAQAWFLVMLKPLDVNSHTAGCTSSIK